MQSQEKPLWSFDISVFGPIQVPSRFALDEVESFFLETVFFRSIEIKGSPHGAQCSIKAYSESGTYAAQVALHAFDLVAHVLALQTNFALVVSRQEARPFARSASSQKRVIEKVEWQQAFWEAHHLLHKDPSYLQGLGHYHKALCADSPLDKYINFFRSIEMVSRSTNPSHNPSDRFRFADVERAFARLWSNKEEWPFLRREEGSLEDLVDIFIKLTGGVISVGPALVGRVSERLELLHRVAHAFLVEWRNKNIHLPGMYSNTKLHIETGWGDLLQ